MNTRLTTRCLAALLLAAPCVASAQNIYKCTKNGQVAYTDQPCAGSKGELLHQADATETIDRYLRLGQNQLAESWAKSHHQEALYRERLELHEQAMKARDERAAQDAALRAQQAQDQAEQQSKDQEQAAQAAQAAARAQLEAENTNLRQQNAAYQAELSQPVYAPVYAPGYWGNGNRWPSRPYPGHDDHDHGHNQRPPPVTAQPLVKACGSLTGGRAGC